MDACIGIELLKIQTSTAKIHRIDTGKRWEIFKTHAQYKYIWESDRLPFPISLKGSFFFLNVSKQTYDIGKGFYLTFLLPWASDSLTDLFLFPAGSIWRFLSLERASFSCLICLSPRSLGSVPSFPSFPNDFLFVRKPSTQTRLRVEKQRFSYSCSLPEGHTSKYWQKPTLV